MPGHHKFTTLRANSPWLAVSEGEYCVAAGEIDSIFSGSTLYGWSNDELYGGVRGS